MCLCSSSTFALVVLLLVHATAAPAHCNGYACMRCCVMIGRVRVREREETRGGGGKMDGYATHSDL
jgi:hypothetical protein